MSRPQKSFLSQQQTKFEHQQKIFSWFLGGSIHISFGYFVLFYNNFKIGTEI